MDENLKKKPSRLKYIIAAVISLLIITVIVFILLTQEEPKPDPASEKIIREAAAEQLNINKVFNELTDTDRVQIKAIVLSPRLKMIPNRPTDEEIMNFLRTGGSAAAKFNKDPNNPIDPNSLTDEDFATITEFSIIKKKLTDVKLLEKFTNLQELTLSGIKFPEKDIPSWMKILSKLGIFDLNERFAIDLSPLKNLSNLQSLNLASTQVSDLEPLKDLINLQTLYIDGCNQVSNIEPLKELTSLQILLLVNTQVSELEPLKELKNLKEIYILNCPNITDQEVKGLQKALPNLKIER